MSQIVIIRRVIVISLLLIVVGFSAGLIQKQKEKKTVTPEKTKIRFINRSPLGYSHIAEARGGRTLYIAGQLALDKDGTLVGKGDFHAQVKQVFENLKTRLEEAGASFKDVVKLNYYITDASGIPSVREVRNAYINTENPPASTLVVVKQLVREEYLIEVEAIAVTNDWHLKSRPDKFSERHRPKAGAAFSCTVLRYRSIIATLQIVSSNSKISAKEVST